MLCEKKINNDGLVIAIWRVEEEVSDLFNLLNNKELYSNNLKRYTSGKRQKEWLAARVLAEMVCGKDKTITYNDNGKPFLTDNSFQISISHTKNFVAFIAHPTQKVGIDIEQISNQVCELKERFLGVEELQSVDKQNNTIHLLLHWCAKEVMFKMMNRQNVHFSEQLHIKPFVPKENGMFFGKETRTNRQENYTFAYSIKKDYVLVWAIN